MTFSKGTWIFGYGSLIWKVDFPIEDQKFGYIVGYGRRFWQKSHDHRGTPESPGLVATLIPEQELRVFEQKNGSEPEICWGMAYKIKSGQEEQVMKHLDYREKDGYTLHNVKFYTDSPSSDHSLAPAPAIENALVYIGRTDNPSFGGPIDTESVARTITSSVGPSGSNIDYLLNLIKALRMNYPFAIDPHLNALEALVSQ